MARAKALGAPLAIVRYVHEHGKLPVPNFAAGGIATPPDAVLCMALGAESIFSAFSQSVQPEIFKSYRKNFSTKCPADSAPLVIASVIVAEFPFSFGLP
jgi:pyridoxal 5'-phosphate synthase pdxS subunit